MREEPSDAFQRLHFQNVSVLRYRKTISQIGKKMVEFLQDFFFLAAKKMKKEQVIMDTFELNMDTFGNYGFFYRTG